MIPRFAEHAQGPARQAYMCARAIYRSHEGTTLSSLTMQSATGRLWLARTTPDQIAARGLQERGVLEPVPALPGAYILTSFGNLVAGAYTLLCFDIDP